MFREELESVINRHSMENGSNTPDFLLAGFLNSCLDAFDHAVRERDKWYSISPAPGKSGAHPPQADNTAMRKLLERLSRGSKLLPLSALNALACDIACEFEQLPQ
jgi:hypothetical protein